MNKLLLNSISILLIQFVGFHCSFCQFVQFGNKLKGYEVNQGRNLSLSSDGQTLAMGAYVFNSNTTQGSVLIFTLSGGNWKQVGGRLGSSGENFSGDVSLSSDGKTLAVGTNESNGVRDVRVYTYSGGVWTTQTGSKLYGTSEIGNAYQGTSVSLSADGKTVAIGGPEDNTQFGGVWIFNSFSFGTWTQNGNKLIGTGSVGNPYQGSAVSLSSDGKTLAIGGSNDNGSLGAVWIYTLVGSKWKQFGYKLVGTGAVGSSRQGSSVSLSSNGTTLAVGGRGDNGGIGAVWVYTLSGGNWNQMGSKLVGSNAIGKSNQGVSVSLSSDGTTLAVGGDRDDEKLTNGAYQSTGAVWIYKLSDGNWLQFGNKVIGSDTVGKASQGSVVNLSSDGKTLAVAGSHDNYFPNNVGAVWIFSNSGNVTDFQKNEINLNSISIYPNPSNQSFFVDSIKDYTYSIFDLNGNMLETGQTGFSTIGIYLFPGVYQMKIDTKIYKIVKMDN